MKKLKLIVILFSAFIIIMSCSNDDTTGDFESSGQIIGRDVALCACCGNWIIEIDGEQNPYQFLELPNNSDIDLDNANFPLSVRLNWSESNGSCKLAIISEIIEN